MLSQIHTDDFNAYATGDVATDPTGTAPGSTGYYIYSGSPSDYQITSIDAAHGKSIKITSGNSFLATNNTVNNRNVFRYITPPTPGVNDEVIVGTADIYTGSTISGAVGNTSVDLYDYKNGQNIGVVGVGFNYGTRQVFGKARLTYISTGTTNYINIIFSSSQTYPDNTWITVKFIYEISTGAYYWITPEGTFTLSNSAYSSTPNLSFTEIDLINTTYIGNTVANDAIFDNINFKYSTLANAGIGDIIRVGDFSKVNIYPNPATNFIKIDTEEKILSIKFYDITGKQINVNSTDKTVDVSNLSNGDYILNIVTEVGETSHKIIKK